MKLRATVTVLNVLVFVTSLLISSSATRQDRGLFGILFGNHSTVRAARKYSLDDVVPARWALYIWYFIYAWQSAWIVYSVSLLCSSRVPEVLSPLFFVLFILTRVCNVTWSILFTWGQVQICAFILLVSVIAQYATLAESYWRFDKIYNDRFPVFDFWAVQILVHNGLGLYATWSTILLHLNLGSAVAYFHDIDKDICSTVVLSLLGIELIVWLILEYTVLERFVRYTLAIYPAVIWAFSAILARKFVSNKRNSILTAVLLFIASALFVARVVYLTWRMLTHKNAANDNVTLTSIDVLRATWNSVPWRHEVEGYQKSWFQHAVAQDNVVIRFTERIDWGKLRARLF